MKHLKFAILLCALLIGCSQKDNSYAQQTFNSELYRQIREQEATRSTTGNVEYEFEDVRLVFSRQASEPTQISIFPKEELPSYVATDYARVLDVDSVINFESGGGLRGVDVDRPDKRVTAERHFEELNLSEEEDTPGVTDSDRSIRMSMTTNGGVTEIAFIDATL